MSTIVAEVTAEDLHRATKARKDSNQEYWDLVKRAKAEGWTNTRIAAAVGVSEAAIRLYWTRHPTTPGY